MTNEHKQYQLDKADCAHMACERAEIDPGVGLARQDPLTDDRGAKSAASIDRWYSPLSISALTLARLNFLYS